MVKKILMFCLLAVASMLLSIVGGSMVIIALAGGAATTVSYLKYAAVLWITGTAIAVLSIIAITYYLIHTPHPRPGNQSHSNQGNDFHSNITAKGRKNS